MNRVRVNRLLFWLLAIVPMVATLMIGKIFGPIWFVVFLLTYVLVYRPILHIVRLLSLKRIEAKDAWKFFLPFYASRYLRSLWLG